ncbi:uncharacterized protein LOC116954161 [Petromyzon marinus]|uniref:uncharacterized protein LOC116954161 n=1 Tax=Petromyzon marinus TaxID=7757 RepID=UPI003F72FEF1
MSCQSVTALPWCVTPTDSPYTYRNAMAVSAVIPLLLMLLSALSCIRAQAQAPTCGAPPQISHGHVVKPKGSYTAQEEAQYECDDGYTLHGPRAFCSGQGWSHTPSCDMPCKVTSDDLEAHSLEIAADSQKFRRGSSITRLFKATTYKIPPGEMANFACRKKSVAVGPLSAICLQGALELPFCEPESCRRLEVAHGKLVMSEDTVRHNHSASLACDAGYEGYSKISCKAGVWEPTPVCCARPAVAVPNGQVKVNRETLTAELACSTGFEPVKGQQVACRSGAFDTKAFACKERKCDPRASDYPHVKSLDKGKDGYTYTVKCKSDHAAFVPTVRCEQGIMVPAPYCCSSTHRITHGSVGVGHGLGNVHVNITCEPGYHPPQETHVLCVHGEWPADRIKCNKVTGELTEKKCMWGLCIGHTRDTAVLVNEEHKVLKLTAPQQRTAAITLSPDPKLTQCLSFTYVARMPWTLKLGKSGDATPLVSLAGSAGYGGSITALEPQTTEARLELKFQDLMIQALGLQTCNPTEISFVGSDPKDTQERKAPGPQPPSSPAAQLPHPAHPGPGVQSPSSPGARPPHQAHADGKNKGCQVPEVFKLTVTPTQAEYKPGDRAVFRCADGLYPLPWGSVCLPSGHWESITQCVDRPVCVLPKPPAQVALAERSPQPVYQPGDSLTYSCAAGWKLPPVAGRPQPINDAVQCAAGRWGDFKCVRA